MLAMPRALVIAMLWGLTHLADMPLTLASAVIASDALVLIWQITRYHHSADAHIRDTGAMVASWGGYFACFLALLASATLWWDLVLIATRPPVEETFDQQMRREREQLYVLEVASDGIELRFEGEITYGLKARLTGLLVAHPNLRRMSLTSPGGHVFEARGTAQVISAAGLDTYVEGDCTSACTLLFAAGQRRSLAPDARLGFHGYGFATVVHLPGYDIEAAQDKDRAFFLSHGIDPMFVARMYDTPAQDMWFPDLSVLRAAGWLRD
ncbi:hypothetical protein [Tritonibacter scottomollicae]|uniref:COG3904 family protein n=1 Tax=Tritonibacter scottomollicae TaxID=483013 RepID=UPI003AA9CF01